MSKADLQWQTITNLQHWKCVPLDVVSPAYLWKACGGKWHDGAMPQAFGLQRKPGAAAQVDILRFHAGEAFAGISHDLIDLVLQHECAVDYDKSRPFAENIILAIRAVLGCGDLSAAEVLEQRATVETLAIEAADVLESEEAFDALSAKDAQEAESLLKAVATTKQAAADVRAVCASFRSGAGPKPKRRKPVARPTCASTRTRFWS